MEQDPVGSYQVPSILLKLIHQGSKSYVPSTVLCVLPYFIESSQQPIEDNIMGKLRLKEVQ